MQVVILAAGKSSRFYPFNTTHKSCIYLLGKTIIEHTIESIRKSGIQEIVIVVSSDNHIKDILGDGSKFGVNIAYSIQKEPNGAGQALLQVRELIHDDFFVINANRLEFHEFSDSLLQAKKTKDCIVLLTKKTSHAKGAGVVKLTGDRVIDIIEKPIEDAVSNTRIVGMYLLPKTFFDTLVEVPKEHYSFEKALLAYAKNHLVIAVDTKRETVSLKYPWDILHMKNYLLKNMPAYRGKNCTIAKSALITGIVYIADGVTIMENVVIKGPCYIGKNAYIGTNVLLRNGVVLENDVVIGANMEIKNSVIFDHTTTHSGFIGDSVIGANCKLAAYFCTANVRLDRGDIHVTYNQTKVNAHLASLGVLMGDNVKAGIRVGTMPGMVVGKHVVIGPQTTVIHSIEDGNTYYTKFAEVVEKKKK